MIESFKKVAVIGAGTMGNGIVHVFAQHGYEVNLIDISQAAIDKGLAVIEKNMDRQIKKEKITVADKAAALGRITTYTELEKAVADRDIVIEAATENIDLKLSIFKDLAKFTS
ncbi:MAG: 3-hydroxyacyl-CoA dehydrogenase NAD-binding domain-containing protein, partial [Bacteroidota bacterium]